MLALLAGTARASVVESAGWAVLNSVEASTGYDSNLDFTHDSSGSSFACISPTITLRRKHSLMRFDTEASATATGYSDRSVGSQLDWSLATGLEYPYTDDGFPRARASFAWRRYTAANQWLGRRVSLDQLLGDIQGRALSSERTGLVLGLRMAQTSSPSEAVNRNQNAQLTVGLAYDLSPKTELSLNYLGILANSLPRTSGHESVRSVQHTLGIQARGDLLGKLTGSALLGVSQVRFHSAYSRSDALPYARINLAWAIDPKRQLSWTAELDADFSPEGESIRNYRNTLRYRQQIQGPWSWELTGGVSYDEYFRQQFVRNDTLLLGGCSLHCEVSEGFSFSLSSEYRTQWSTFERFDYSRLLVELAATYRY